MHNNIMAAGSKDRPPMLGPGRYSQWRSRFLRYIDTKPNGGRLKKSILSGPYVPTTVQVQAVEAAEGRPAVPQHTSVETILNMPPENKRTRLIVESIHIKFDEIKEMMSDHNSSDLAPQRQEMSIENVSSGLVPQGQKASDYDNSDPEPPRQNVVPSAEKPDSSHQGLEFLFNPLLEEYYNPTHDQAEENNNDQAPNASFQEAEFVNPFCTRVQEIGESSSRIIDNTDEHSFQPQSHDYRWTRDHPFEQIRGNPTMPVQTRRQLTTDPEMCMFALTVSIVEPKNIKEAMADSAWIEAMQMKLSISSTD
ncbi:hypothetical protein Tco_0456008 [Tanacetum coccineum]